jgi:hypothetical protein
MFISFSVVTMFISFSVATMFNTHSPYVSSNDI